MSSGKNCLLAKGVLLIWWLSVADLVAGLQAFVGQRGVLCFITDLLNYCFPHSDKGFSPKFNERGGEVERRSLNSVYVVENGRPR